MCHKLRRGEHWSRHYRAPPAAQMAPPTLMMPRSSAYIQLRWVAPALYDSPLLTYQIEIDNGTATHATTADTCASPPAWARPPA